MKDWMTRKPVFEELRGQSTVCLAEKGLLAPITERASQQLHERRATREGIEQRLKRHVHLAMIKCNQASRPLRYIATMVATPPHQATIGVMGAIFRSSHSIGFVVVSVGATSTPAYEPRIRARLSITRRSMRLKEQDRSSF
jgi:hypothetical protein